MPRLRVVTSTVGRLSQTVWAWALELYARVRRPRAEAAASSIRRQYVFGAVGRKVFDAAIRQRRRVRRGKGT